MKKLKKLKIHTSKDREMNLYFIDENTSKESLNGIDIFLLPMSIKTY